jgi:hypothetical protein
MTGIKSMLSSMIILLTMEITSMTPETKEKILDYIAKGITIVFVIAILWAISNTFQNLFN